MYPPHLSAIILLVSIAIPDRRGVNLLLPFRGNQAFVPPNWRNCLRDSQKELLEKPISKRKDRFILQFLFWISSGDRLIPSSYSSDRKRFINAATYPREQGRAYLARTLLKSQQLWPLVIPAEQQQISHKLFKTVGRKHSTESPCNESQ